MAEVCRNRTDRPAIDGTTGFEVQGSHQTTCTSDLIIGQFDSQEGNSRVSPIIVNEYMRHPEWAFLLPFIPAGLGTTPDA